MRYSYTGGAVWAQVRGDADDDHDAFRVRLEDSGLLLPMMMIAAKM